MINIQYKNIDHTDKNFLSILKNSEIASQKIRKSIEDKVPAYNIFSIENAIAQVKDSKKYINEITNNFSDLIIIGMGGSILNPQAIINLNYNQYISKVKIHFLSNTDPFFLQKLLDNIPLSTSAILAISNSGQTLETNALVGVMISVFEKNGIKDLSKRFFFITESNKSIMYKVAKKIDATIIQHTPLINGRFSGLTNVSTLAAGVAGIDVEEYIDGAHNILQDFLNNKSGNNPISIAASTIYFLNKPIIVNIGYLQQFSIFLEWYLQIIAESLGKEGAGFTPIRGLGPNDQHSMLQLYLDGPSDKLFNLFYLEEIPNFDLNTCSFSELDYIANKKLCDINKANFIATENALTLKNKPLRTIKLKNLTARTLGMLVTHSMLEVITLAHMMEINPFDQPGVELIKIKSKNQLSTDFY